MRDFVVQTEGYARLVYTTESTRYTEDITGVDCEDLDRLKELTKDDTFIITKTMLTRGVDYRAASGTIGIALLIMSSMPSERALIQLLGRVGRYYERCKRMQWD